MLLHLKKLHLWQILVSVLGKYRAAFKCVQGMYKCANHPCLTTEQQFLKANITLYAWHVFMTVNNFELSFGVQG